MQPVILVTSKSRELAEPVVRAFAGQVKFCQLSPPPIPFCAQVKEAPPHLCQLGDYSVTTAPLVDLTELSPEQAVEDLRSRIQALDSGPGIVDMGRSALGDLMKWSAIRFGRCTEEQIEERLRQCKSCPYWEPEAFKGTGRCKKCGCSTWAKLKLKSSSCPDGRWSQISVEEDNNTVTVSPELQ